MLPTPQLASLLAVSSCGAHTRTYRTQKHTHTHLHDFISFSFLFLPFVIAPLFCFFFKVAECGKEKGRKRNSATIFIWACAKKPQIQSKNLYFMHVAFCTPIVVAASASASSSPFDCCFLSLLLLLLLLWLLFLASSAAASNKLITLTSEQPKCLPNSLCVFLRLASILVFFGTPCTHSSLAFYFFITLFAFFFSQKKNLTPHVCCCGCASTYAALITNDSQYNQAIARAPSALSAKLQLISCVFYSTSCFTCSAFHSISSDVIFEWPDQSSRGGIRPMPRRLSMFSCLDVCRYFAAAYRLMLRYHHWTKLWPLVNTGDYRYCEKKN